MTTRGKCARQRRQVSLNFPLARHAVARGCADAVQVGLEQAGCPELVEGSVEISHQQCGTTRLAMACDLWHELLGEDAFGGLVSLSAAYLGLEGTGQDEQRLAR